MRSGGDPASAGPGVFDRLLAWFDEGVDSRGETYFQLRRRLVAYFRRKRCTAPEDLADEALMRVARRLDEEGAITGTTPAQYCYTVARFVFLEYLRQPERADTPLEAARGGSWTAAAPAASPVADDELRTFECFERCLAGLPAADRELILEYYQGDGGTKIANRRVLARRMDLTPNALSIRACRIRARLEACVLECGAMR